MNETAKLIEQKIKELEPVSDVKTFNKKYLLNSLVEIEGRATIDDLDDLYAGL